jgi:hypothetical protein
MACKRSAVRSRLAPPRFALRASRGAATQEPKERSVVPGVALLGEDGLERTTIARAPMWYVYITAASIFLSRNTLAQPLT